MVTLSIKLEITKFNVNAGINSVLSVASPGMADKNVMPLSIKTFSGGPQIMEMLEIARSVRRE